MDIKNILWDVNTASDLLSDLKNLQALIRAVKYELDDQDTPDHDGVLSLLSLYEEVSTAKVMQAVTVLDRAGESLRKARGLT